MRSLFALLVLAAFAVPAAAQEAAAEAPADDTMALVMGAAAGLIGLGVLVSRFTKTDKDDAFFARISGVFKSLKR